MNNQPPDQPPAPPQKVVIPEVMPPGPDRAEPPPVGSPAADLPRGLTKRRLIIAFAVAGISDALSFGTGLIEPVQLPLDIITAAILFVVLGWRWPLLLGLVMEAIPGVAMFPAWVMVVAAIAALGSPRPGAR